LLQLETLVDDLRLATRRPVLARDFPVRFPARATLKLALFCEARPRALFGRRIPLLFREVRDEVRRLPPVFRMGIGSNSFRGRGPRTHGEGRRTDPRGPGVRLESRLESVAGQEESSP
jgi:class 3 adenylate cyclase